MHYPEGMTGNGVVYSFRRVCPYIIIITLFVFALFMGLGVLRLYSFRLECRLNSVNKQIESYSNRSIVLKHELSTLVSPSRVYGSSIRDLGMAHASNVRVLKIEEGTYANAAQDATLPVSLASENRGWFYFFLEKAMAGE